jgi:UDP-N-acetylmuramoyl-L-alanyl-D-glutamate--2,6-diaminopimelate ligase
MKLNDLLHNLEIEDIRGGRDIEVSGVTHDSRSAAGGFLFVAIDGLRYSAAQFVHDAVQRGASVIVGPAPAADAQPRLPVTWVTVKDPRSSLSRLAANFHGRPTEKMKVVGITGTSGKTTCCYLVSAVLRAAGIPAGLMGTIEVNAGGGSRRSTLTTPEATDIHAAAAEMLAAGMKAMVMEVSSHSLKLRRVDDVDFDIGVFTNLGHDHLDFHGDIADYAASKSILFSRLLKAGEGTGAVVNGMDPSANEITAGYRGRVVRFGLEDEIGIDISPAGFHVSVEGIMAAVRSPWGKLEVFSPLLGVHNLLNIMAASGVGLLAGIPVERIEEGIAALEKVPGRMDRIAGRDGRLVVVDYSHTPDSLRAALDSLSRLAKGRIITVFGAGGDREKEKRPLMGRAACEKSTSCVVTSDNPRSEDPRRIIDMIVEGLEEGGFRKVEGELRRGCYVVLPDRREAIGFAISRSLPGDVILVAGKGHEDYQIFKDGVVHFDDREEVIEALKRSGFWLDGDL